jgi:FkbM family methyltransferase
MSGAVKRRVGRLIQRAFNSIGLEVTASRRMRSCKTRLRQARDLGFSPQTIVDGGAFTGKWSRTAADLFPGTQLILFEPNPFLQGTISKNLASIEPAPIIIESALGAAAGTASFNLWQAGTTDTGASLLDHVAGAPKQQVEVSVVSMDEILAQHSLAPDLLKLDLQGGELQALLGAGEALQQAEMAIIEFGCLEAYLGRTTPRELFDLMYDHDYCLYDIIDLNDRPYDGALTGGDFFFVKNTSPLRRYKAWE